MKKARHEPGFRRSAVLGSGRLLLFQAEGADHAGQLPRLLLQALGRGGTLLDERGARMLVWKAMPSITPMMSAILFELVMISSIVATTCVTTWPLRCATAEADDASWFAWFAASALWRTVLVSCSIELAVCCRLLAACSVRTERSALPAATSPLATWIDSAPARTLPDGCCGRPRSPPSSHRPPRSAPTGPLMSSTLCTGVFGSFSSAASACD